MITIKYILYFFISLLSKKKRYIIITPNLLFIFIKNILIFDKYKKNFFVQKIQGYGDYLTILEIFFNSDYDLKKFRFWKKVKKKITKNKIPLIIDCGANIGCSTLFFYNNHPDSFIVALEPEKNNFDLLNENTKKIKNKRLINSAVSSKEHNFILKKSNDARAHKVLKINNKFNSKKSYTVNKIVKDYSEKEFELFLIKIDIEGFEKELFETNTQMGG
jgi:methyltransferase, FkbM family